MYFGVDKKIKEDLKASPVVRLIKDQEKYVQDQIDKINEYIQDVPNDYLTKEELDLRITKIEDSLNQELEKIKEENSDLKSQISKVITELETLKQQTSILPKKALIKSFFIRFSKMVAKHPQVVKLIGLSIKQILPENIKSHIPDTALDILMLAPNGEQNNDERKDDIEPTT